MGDWVLRMTMGCQGLLIRALEAMTHDIEDEIGVSMFCSSSFFVFFLPLSF